MRNLDKLLKEAKQLFADEPVKKYGIHIVEGGYCYSCKGLCKYIRDDSKQVLVDDIVAVEVPEEVNSFDGIPKNTLIKLANLIKEGEKVWLIKD